MPDHERAEGFEKFVDSWRRAMTPADERPTYTQTPTWNDYAEHHPPKETTMGESTAPSLLTSIVRTVVPVVVGLIITGALRVGLDLPEGPVTEVVTAAVIAAYYAVARLAEEKLSPRFGWLLGRAKAPEYPAA